MDTRLYLDINRLARESFWAHALMRDYSSYLGIALLSCLCGIALWRSRSDRSGDDGALRRAALICSLAAAGVAAGAVELSSALIRRPPPYQSLHGIEVLTGRIGSSSMPSLDGALAATIVVGLWLSRDVLLAALATGAGGLLAYSTVYVGASYPSDVLVGIAFGALFAGLSYPLASRVSGLAGPRADSILGGIGPLLAPAPGPAALAPVLGSSGSVKLLSDQVIRPRQLAGLDGARRSGVPSS